MTLYRNDVTKIALSRANEKHFFLLKKAARCCHHGLDPTYCSLEFDLPMIEVDIKYSGSNCGRDTFLVVSVSVLVWCGTKILHNNGPVRSFKARALITAVQCSMSMSAYTDDREF